MSTLVWLTFTFTLIQLGFPVSCVFLEENCGLAEKPQKPIKNLLPRIVQGIEAEFLANPWMVSLLRANKFVCGGTLISNRYVLTAAHCTDNGTALVAQLGAYNRSNHLHCENSVSRHKCYRIQEFLVDRHYIPSTYQPGHYDDDICLLRLEKMVVYTDHIRPICVLTDPRKQPILDAVSHFKAAGWGDTEHVKESEILMEVDINREEWDSCSAIFWNDDGVMLIREEREDSKICGKGKMKAFPQRADTCNGDSGGPISTVTVINGKERTTQLGVVSFGTEHCTGIGVYTNVMYYVNWIKQTVEEDIKVLLPKKDLLDQACYENYSPSDPHPWLATVYLFRFVLAYGALISNKFVVTTASLLPTTAPLEVGLAGGATYHVKAMHKHPNFTSVAADDIALLQLADFVQYTALKRPLCMPSTPEETEVFQKKNSRLTEAIAVNSEIGSVVELPKHHLCAKYGNISIDQICTRTQFVGQQLGSGSPLVTTIVTGTQIGYTLVGLASYEGPDNGLTVYTNVNRYMPWIIGFVNKTTASQ
ncbi:clotting factor G beta subunit [Drosophila bipectinata]|uniref:clotting factor G beta subunit n=1 Tax=Drosophila bipectinata TaxID=42026 RepID=UPI0038B26D0E